MTCGTMPASLRFSRHQSLAVTVCMIVVYTALAPGSVAAAGVFGVDVSEATPAPVFACLNASHNVTYAIVRAYRSLGIPDTACPDSVAAAWAAGLDRVRDVACSSACGCAGLWSRLTHDATGVDAHRSTCTTFPACLKAQPLK